MSLQEAAQQALEALEVWRDCLTNPDAQPVWRFSVVVERAIADLRDALYEDAMRRFTDVQQQIERHADTSKTSDQSEDALEMVATSQKSRQVEPVAWLDPWTQANVTTDYDAYGKHGIPLYTAPPKRKPLTDEQICEIFIFHGRDKETFARAIERAHGIGGGE